MAEQAVPEGGPKSAPVVIKKYANRRLYNTATSAYVTLEHLSQIVKDKTDFVVYDAKTGDEITRSVLTQIIFEEESKGGQKREHAGDGMTAALKTLCFLGLLEF